MWFARITSIVNAPAWIFVVVLVVYCQNQSNADMERISEQQRADNSAQMERERAFMRWTVSALNAEREARNAAPIPAPEALFEEASSPDLLCLQSAIEVFPEALFEEEHSFNCSFSVPELKDPLEATRMDIVDAQKILLEEAASRRH